jgi:hypothetical protein
MKFTNLQVTRCGLSIKPPSTLLNIKSRTRTYKFLDGIYIYIYLTEVQWGYFTQGHNNLRKAVHVVGATG